MGWKMGISSVPESSCIVLNGRDQQVSNIMREKPAALPFPSVEV